MDFYKDWYTLRNLETNQDVLSSTKITDIIKFLKDKDLSKFRVDTLVYKPTSKHYTANDFLHMYDK